MSGLAKLSAEQQIKLAKAIEKENAKFVDIVKENEGVLTVKGRNQLSKMRENALSSILSDEQLRQYYCGVFDKEADAEELEIHPRGMLQDSTRITGDKKDDGGPAEESTENDCRPSRQMAEDH